MKEEVPRSELVARGRKSMPGFLFFRHEDKFSHGVPDASIVGLKLTSWWEVKLIEPGETDFESEGIQELTMRRLAMYGGCAYYIVFQRHTPKQRQAFIVHPDDLGTWKTLNIASPIQDEFPYDWVLKFIWSKHAAIARV